MIWVLMFAIIWTFQAAVFTALTNWPKGPLNLFHRITRHALKDWPVPIVMLGFFSLIYCHHTWHHEEHNERLLEQFQREQMARNAALAERERERILRNRAVRLDTAPVFHPQIAQVGTDGMFHLVDMPKTEKVAPENKEWSKFGGWFKDHCLNSELYPADKK